VPAVGHASPKVEPGWLPIQEAESRRQDPIQLAAKWERGHDEKNNSFKLLHKYATEKVTKSDCCDYKDWIKL
jgi:hypothetical protein